MPEPPGFYAFSLGYQSLLYSFVVFFFWQNNQNHMYITKIFAYNGNLFLCKYHQKQRFTIQKQIFSYELYFIIP